MEIVVCVGVVGEKEAVEEEEASLDAQGWSGGREAYSTVFLLGFRTGC